MFILDTKVHHILKQRTWVAENDNNKSKGNLILHFHGDEDLDCDILGYETV
jgi:hypothetical protein